MKTFTFDAALAKEVGVNAAVIHWNIAWWVEKNEATGTNIHDGKAWTYNTRKSFSELFWFMSEDAVKRAVNKLVSRGYIEKGEFNEDPWDRTNWYTVTGKTPSGPGENAHSTLGENAHSTLGENAQSYISTDINTDINPDVNLHCRFPNDGTDDPDGNDGIPYAEIVAYLNDKAGTKYRVSTQKTRTLIHARWEEGFRLEDFRQVIDSRCTAWLHDPRFSRFIRPETLFGTKFESYLNVPQNQNTRGVDFSIYE